jgi:hypothetical protein
MAPHGSLERCFHSGLVLGFNEVVSILQQQHDAFQIGRRELRLDDVAASPGFSCTFAGRRPLLTVAENPFLRIAEVG